jgi:hypothetical protein
MLNSGLAMFVGQLTYINGIYLFLEESGLIASTVRIHTHTTNITLRKIVLGIDCNINAYVSLDNCVSLSTANVSLSSYVQPTFKAADYKYSYSL